MKGHRNKVQLSDDERGQLLKLSHKPSAPYRLVIRAKLILMASTRMHHNKIATKLDIHPDSVTKWVKRWNDTSGLKRNDVESRLNDAQRPGVPNTFTPEQKCQITSIACEVPEVYERPITHWTHHELADEVAKQGIVKSIASSQVGRILKKTEIRPHKSKYWLNAKPDELGR